jgi:putative Mg2+ transporter-C (MgtC) family protein
MSNMSAWEVLSHMVSLVIAYALALPIGWNREREERSAGIRTFPLVAMAACGFVLVAIGVLGKESAGQARIIEGLIVGVGFIGGGAILKHGTQTVGTATAASLWATGALGAAVGYGLYDIAAVLSASVYLTFHYFSPPKKLAQEADQPNANTPSKEL